MSEKTVGILGGMGPAATADIFMKITACTKAACDQEHLHVIIDSNTAIPDRTAALLHGGESPVKELVCSTRRLEAAGAGLIVMPCNTAHGFYDAVSDAVSIPVLHMIRITADALVKRGIKRAGLLATDGTVQSGIYSESFGSSGIELILPDAAGQHAVMDISYGGVKAGVRDFDTTDFKKAADGLISRGAQMLILGCTELPVAFEMYDLDYPAVDPTLELARTAVISAGGRLK